MRIRSFRRLADVMRLMSRHALLLVRRHLRVMAIDLAVVVSAILACLPLDRPAAEWMNDNRETGIYELAKDIRVWGDFIDTVVISSAVFGLGAFLRSRRLQLAAVACFTAAVMSGLSANVLRFTAGRPRPSADLPDRLHGPTFNHRLQSFPSGHCSTSTANAVAMAVACPPLAAPVLISSGAIAWASLYTRRHYVTDVLAGMAWGTAVGLFYGAAARRLSRRTLRPDPQPVLGGLGRLSVRYPRNESPRGHLPSPRAGPAGAARPDSVGARDAVAPSH